MLRAADSVVMPNLVVVPAHMRISLSLLKEDKRRSPPSKISIVDAILPHMCTCMGWRELLFVRPICN